ncbi:hypothetical protein [Actinoplanes sp. DH11]|uniref:hypothetical protein n=1 Tax=Actinoplanes sp. DH11 TaxID=2857011 RepID=UPI001E5BCCDA|nr:hypothetical protein [Actinoplanes sp. DH11]
MANDESNEPVSGSGLYVSATADTPERRNRRRKQAIVGIAGAAAVLAGVGFLVTQLNDSGQPSLPEPAALAPQTLPTSASAEVPASAEPSVSRTSKMPKPADAVETSPSPTPSVSPAATPSASAAQSSAAAKDLSTKLAKRAGPVSERTEVLANGTIRIVSAPRDLSGEREMLLADGKGKPAGKGVNCTTKVRFNTGVPEGDRPTVLLCWRTSSARSVVTMAVTPAGDPPTASSVEIIGKEWQRIS